MKTQDVQRSAGLAYRLSNMARQFATDDITLRRLNEVDQIMGEVLHFAVMFDQARHQDPEGANRTREEAMARWTAFITGEQGS